MKENKGERWSKAIKITINTTIGQFSKIKINEIN
jgi:hypothetical protein